MRIPYGVALIPLLLAPLSGCDPSLVANLTEERSGNVNVQFVNTTRFRASFSFGSYDAFDRDPPGPVTFLQIQVETGNSSPNQALVCRRNVALGTQEFLDRVLDVNADAIASFDPDAFSPDLNFSSAPIGDDADSLPTAGTAAGTERRLGVDFTCGDLIIFTFVEDAGAPGGIRIDYEVIADEEADQ
jgi:hypothetical protein